MAELESKFKKCLIFGNKLSAQSNKNKNANKTRNAAIPNSLTRTYKYTPIPQTDTSRDITD